VAKNIFKILLMGLDEAGKTSILLSMAGEYDPSRVKPTFGAERTEISILGFPIYRWDLGGQEQYRSDYLQKRSRILDDTDLLFYVVDMKDQNRFKESLLYYIDILNYFREIGLMPLIVILLHKADPEFLKTTESQKTIKFLIDTFNEKSDEFEVSYFITSIFNRKSLIDAFSQNILKLFPKLSALDTLLSTFIVDASLDGVLMFDSNCFIVGNAYRQDEKKKDAILKAINNIYFLFEDLIKSKRLGYDPELDLKKLEDHSTLQFVFRPLTLGRWNLFVLLIGQDIIEVDAILEILKRNYEGMKTFFVE
jgi:GTPase SAR1 family protein